jgi:hypothetical protein
LKIRVFTLIFLLIVQTGFSQLVFGVKVTGLAFHPRPINGSIFRGKLDKKGHLVINGGMALTAQYYANQNVGVGIGQVIMPQDCGGKWFGASQIGLALKYDLTPNHSINGVFGPMVFYRQNWADIAGYKDDVFFKKSKNLSTQYKFVWYGVNFEYTYWYANKTGVSFNLLPGIPEVLEFSAGMSFR